MVAEFCPNLLLKISLWVLSLRGEPNFGRWVRLEEQKNSTLKAVEESSDDFPDHLLRYISTALCVPIWSIEKAGWIRLFDALYRIAHLTRCQYKLPIFEPSGEKEKKDPWDYDGRVWYVYVHLLAKTYGWTVEYIENLSLRDALTCVQEILIDDQLEKEFQWTMSERSAYYDDRTKATKLNPLPRPGWMNKHIDPVKELRVVKIPTGMMPAGTGISQSELAQTTIH